MLPGAAAWAAAALCVALGAVVARERALLRGRGAPAAIELHPDGQAEVVCRDGVRLAALGGAGHVNRCWVILELRGTRRSRLLVAAGMLDPEGFRRLRLWALWGRFPQRIA